MTDSLQSAHGSPVCLEAEHTDGVAFLRLNRPRVRNALNSETAVALRAALVAADADESVGCIVVTGAGTAFCSGGDLTEIAAAHRDGRPQDAVLLCRLIADTFRTVEEIATPVIAAVNGPAYAGGLALCLAADLIVAAHDARFAVPEAGIGLADPYMPARLSLRIGSERAKWMMLTGTVVDAATANSWGLAIEVAPEGRLTQTVQRMASLIAGQSASSHAIYKKLLLRTYPPYDMPDYLALLGSPQSARLLQKYARPAGDQASPDRD
jgi:enoyl-CoA hydratase/carnithine racemase